jgi:hypothetical protein
MIDLEKLNDPLTTLKQLKHAVDSTISYLENDGPMKDLNSSTIKQWQDNLGKFDFSVGNFGITVL